MKKQDKVLITGVAGFAGSYLAELLLSEGFRIYGLLAPRENIRNIRSLKNDIILDRFDITNEARVSKYVMSIGADYIFHLAAFSSVGRSFANERLTYDVNFMGTLNVFEAAALQAGKLKKLVFISSGDAYGKGMPVKAAIGESRALNPISPYGISKAAGEFLARNYARRYRLPITIARAFNHTGPRQAPAFVVPSFCRQIARIEKKLAPPTVGVGNLAVKRDLSDVRDVVRGYYKLALEGKPGEAYNLCSGRAVAIKTVLDRLLRMSETTIKVSVDRSKFRKADIPVLRGDNQKARRNLRWQCRYKLGETLRDTLQYWREQT